MIEIQQFGKYRCRVAMRSDFEGRPIRPKCEGKDGSECILQAGWLMDEDDPYPGEWAMACQNWDDGLMKDMGISWIASGDLQILERVK